MTSEDTPAPKPHDDESLKHQAEAQGSVDQEGDTAGGNVPEPLVREEKGAEDADAAAIAAAQALVDEAEYGGREHPKVLAWIIGILCASWSLFQLYLPLPFVPPVDSNIARAVHLGFALLLVFLCFPAFKSKGFIGRFLKKGGKVTAPLTQTKGWPVLDIVLGILAAGAAMYLILDYTGIQERQGRPIWRDVLIGWGLIGLLLSAAWRALGPALPIIAGGMILLRFFGHIPFLEWYETDWWYLRPLTNTKFINQMTMSTEGIYGVPLRVSTTMVFLFVLFGAMLERAGGGRWFTDLAFAAVGRYRGGPGKAAVLASGMTGMISGSSIANTVTTGTFTIPMMKKAGYPATKAGAIEVAASTNGQLMPPIMGAAAFIIANYCQMSYVEVVKHAAIPALISYLALIYITHLEACKLGMRPTPKADLPHFFHTLFRGMHFLIPIAVLVYHLMWKRHSAELSAMWAIATLVVVIVGQHVIAALRDPTYESKPKALIQGLWRSCKDIALGLVAGGKNMMSIGVAVAAAGIIVGLVNLGVGGLITELVGLIAGDSLVLLLILTAIASLILGMGLPTTANYIVMATLTATLIVELAPPGIEIPLIAAHLFVFYFGILADDTPPVGLAAYAASAISRADPIKSGVQGFTYDMRTAILPFMFIYNPTLLLIGVETWYDAVLVFCTGLVAMFAFAAITQRWFLRKVRWWQMPLLLVSMLLLLRHDIAEEWFNLATYAVYAIGIGLFIGTAILQIILDKNKIGTPPGEQQPEPAIAS